MIDTIDTAIILAGGLGTRLRPLTLETPKPLVPIKGKPLIEHTIEQLKSHGVVNIILSVGYMADKIKEYFGDGSRLGVNISYCVENEPLGTGGAMKEAAKNLTAPFIGLNGDNISDFNYTKMIQAYRENQLPVLLTLYPVEDVRHWGIAKLDGHKIVQFIEKPTPEKAPSNLNNAGGYIIDPKVLTVLPEGKCSIEKDLWEKIAPRGLVSSYVHEGQWYPTDTMEKYLYANENFESTNFENKKSNSTKLILNSSIFKAYDIRGEWNKEWNVLGVYRIGEAIVKSLQPKTVAIGRDMRNSSDEIFDQLSNAFVKGGVNVIDLGLCGTELTYFASSFVPYIDVAIMITASHNPGKDNGLKITLRNSISLGLNSGLDKIRDLALSDFQLEKSNVKGLVSNINIWPLYKEHVFRLAKFNYGFNKSISELKVVIDAGNGVGSCLFDNVLSNLGVEVIKMYWEPDGEFPNHPADPFQEKNVEALKKKVVEENADLGIAYDGDGDRVFFVDETGRYVPGYYFSALMTNVILNQSEDSSKEIIAHDPRYYWATRDVVSKHGAKYVKSRVGHTLIKEKMREYNSLFSAECSGHIFYRENNFTESSMLTTLLVLKLISKERKFSNLVNPYFNNYPLSGEFNFTVKNPKEIILKLEEKYILGEICKLDGLSIEFSDWRFNIRTSNTQPLLRLNVEAKSKEIVNKKFEEIKSIIQEGQIINKDNLMINTKYYSDIKKFPSQFLEGAELAKSLFVEGNFNRVVVCGVGGSSLYLDLVKDFLRSKRQLKVNLEACRDYNLPSNCDEKTLFVVASYSGNTEETLSCLKEIDSRGWNYCIFCSGGKLLEHARLKSVPTYLIPGGIQPRLSTGYFIVGLLSLLQNCQLVDNVIDDILSLSKNINLSLNEDDAKSLAQGLVNKVPIVYGSSVNPSLARVAKIKFNENSKVQSFWNNFPELNHNEMVGYTNLVMKPYFIIFKSQFSNPRNVKRMDIFTKIMLEKGLPVKVINLSGDNVFLEMMNAYYFIDHVTFYLAQEYNIDPEPVEMVESFKQLISE